MEVFTGDRRRARSKALDEHVRAENRHDLEGILRTFGRAARYHDEAWSQHYVGLEAVRECYGSLLSAVPDLHVEIVDRHETEDAAILEVLVRGTQEGPLHGLPGTGRRLTPVRHPITVTRALFRALLRRARRELRLEDGHGSPALDNPHTGAG